MKRILSIVALALLTCGAVSAQNNIYRSVIGPYYDASGVLAVADPSTTIAVDIVVEKEQTIVGPYARYAQKYLDVRGSLVEKTTFEVKQATISVVTCDNAYATTPKDEQSFEVMSYMNMVDEFDKVSPDRMSATAVSIESAAADAAQAIFTIRKKRMDLITGDAGENVFGGGLKDALEALDAREQALLELFLGKNIKSTTTHRIIIPLEGTTPSYTIAKLTTNAGLQHATATEGTEIKLNINPSGKSPALNHIAEIDPRDKTGIQVRLADNSTCVVTVGDAVVGAATLPIFEFGRTAYIANTAVSRK